MVLGEKTPQNCQKYVKIRSPITIIQGSCICYVKNNGHGHYFHWWIICILQVSSGRALAPPSPRLSRLRDIDLRSPGHGHSRVRRCDQRKISHAGRNLCCLNVVTRTGDGRTDNNNNNTPSKSVLPRQQSGGVWKSQPRTGAQQWRATAAIRVPVTAADADQSEEPRK